jgi:hypothetical protein
LIKGPLVPIVSNIPLDSDPIYITPVPYDRTVEAKAPWVRIGLNTEILPVNVIKVPAVVPANSGSFKIGLKDYNYIGANYRGDLVLKKAATGTNALADDGEITVTAGLCTTLATRRLSTNCSIAPFKRSTVATAQLPMRSPSRCWPSTVTTPKPRSCSPHPTTAARSAD